MKNRPIYYRYFQREAKALDSILHVSEELIIMQGFQFTQAVNLNELNIPVSSFHSYCQHLFNSTFTQNHQ